MGDVDKTLVWPVGTEPTTQAQLWVNDRLYPWQNKVLKACMRQGSRAAVVTPNESGKTSVLIPVLGLSWMAAFPGSHVVSTAGVERQILENLWPVLRASLAKYPGWIITDDLHIRAPSVRGLPGSTWTAFTTRDPKYAEGFHQHTWKDKDGKLVYAPLLIIIDEGKSFDSEEMMFAFQNRCAPDALLFISTPGEDTGLFFDAFHKDRGDPWECLEVGWEDCPHLREGFNRQIREDEIRRRGPDHPRVLSWIFGKFYRAGGRRLFDNMEDVNDAMCGRPPWLRGNRSFAIEFSGGGDEQVFGHRDGNKIHPLITFHEKNDVRLTDILEKLLRERWAQGEEIIADNGGAGKTCIDMLEARGFYGIRRYMFNAPPDDPNTYRYKGAEDHDAVRMLLKKKSLILPEDRVLEEQMRKRQFQVMNDDNKITMEPKEKVRNRGEDSPDRLDCVVMLCSNMPPPIVMETRRETAFSRCGNTKDCLAALGGGDDGETSVWATGGM